MITVALNASHYLHQSGKRIPTSLLPAGYPELQASEWFFNNRIARYTQEILVQDYGCKVVRCDDVTGETSPTLSARAARANDAKADCFITIDHNAGTSIGNQTGIEIFAKKQADVKSIQLQKTVYEETVKLTGLIGRSNPLPFENWAVLTLAKMPAILCEFGFMNGTKDSKIIITNEFALNCALGIVNALVKIYGLKKIENNEGEIMQIVDELKNRNNVVNAVKSRLAGSPSQAEIDTAIKNNVLEILEYLIVNKTTSAQVMKEYELAKQAGITDGTNYGMPATRLQVALMAYRTMFKPPQP